MTSYLYTLFTVMVCVLFCQCKTSVVQQENCCINYSIELIEESSSPLIDQDHPGSFGNENGYEGGTVFMHNNKFNMFVTEEISGWTKTRTGYWKSTDGVNWVRIGTIKNSVDKTNDPRNSIWSPMPFYNNNEKRWNLFYVGYEKDKNDMLSRGRVFRAYSITSGEEGLAGPYEDVSNTVISYDDKQKDPWEGIQGADSFFPYPVGRKWYAFYGSSDFKTRWDNGLAIADSLGGEWTRDDIAIPTFSYSENPIVSRLKDGSYFCVFDDLSHGIINCHSIGFGYSLDGIEWKQRYLEIPMPAWAKNVRTPQSLIPIKDDQYWIYFTATSISGFNCIGRMKIKIIKTNYPLKKK